MHSVLVYGTLRPGSGNTVKIKGELRNIGWFPGLDINADGEVVCERIENVDDEKLAAFDRYEGYSEENPSNSLYIRTKVGEDWVYVYNSSMEGKELVPDGDWLGFTGEAKGRNAQLAEA